MNCLQCGGKTRVVDSRMVRGTTKRWRECYVCGFRFYTIELKEPEVRGQTRSAAMRAMEDVELAETISKKAGECLCDIICPDGECRAKTGEECAGRVLAWLWERVKT
jgi:hypothetical protein